MKQIVLKTSFLASGVLSAALVFAGGVPMSGAKASGYSTDGYVTDSSGEIVRDSSNKCVRTVAWKPELAIPECDGKAGVAKTLKTTKPSIAVIEKRTPVATKDDTQFVTVSLQAGALFDVDRASIKTRGQEKLNLLARKLKETITTEKVEISGHTDSSGSDAYNQRLSERRAEAVKAYLVTQGVSADKMITVGYGESRPIASNKTSAGRTRNRRVEVKIRATKQIK